jgi:acyl-CoA reductase-like NAD-dependent aldehyde dehydrogenase
MPIALEECESVIFAACEREITRTDAFVQVFAPVAVLIRYDKIEEAIEIANGTKYGLGASVFGPDQRDCMAVAKELECGMVAINDFGIFYVSGICRD